LRMTFDRAKLYSGLQHYPQFSKIKYESIFLDKHADGITENQNHDPLLGWDFDIKGNRARGNKQYTDLPDSGILRIVTIGDSFTFGNDVQDHESFSARLEQVVANTETINMGVPGYGIDQAILKYINFGSLYHPHIVILGIYIEDYERTSVPFFAYSKPVFTLKMDGHFELFNQPVPKPEDELSRIRKQANGEIYSLALIKNLSLRLKTQFIGRETQLIKIDKVITHSLQLLIANLNSTQTKLLVVQFPNGKEFHETPSVWYQNVSSHLIGIYKKLNIQYIDLAKAFRISQNNETISKHYYVHRPDGSIGHLSPHGNTQTAKLIIDALDFNMTFTP